MDKYSLVKRCHNDRRLQAYLYDFMYIDPDKISEEDYFLDTKINAEK